MFTTDPGNKALMIETLQFASYSFAGKAQTAQRDRNARGARQALNTGQTCAAVAAKLLAQPPNVVQLEAKELRLSIECLRTYGRARAELGREERAKLNMNGAAWSEFSAEVCETLAALLEGQLGPQR